MEGGFRVCFWGRESWRGGDERDCWPAVRRVVCERARTVERLGSFVTEPIGIAASVALQQAVGFHLAQAVTQLIEPITVLAEAEGGEDA